jgi:hypothetical protein
MFDKFIGGNVNSVRREYFIPSINVCFNKEKIFRSKEALNMDTLIYHCPTVLRKVLLSEKLVYELTDTLGEANCVSAEKLKNSGIFGPPLDMFFVADEKDFDHKYQSHGSLILPNYIMSYIRDTNLDSNCSPHHLKKSQKNLDRFLEIHFC